MGAVAAGLVFAACTSRPSLSPIQHPRASKVPVGAHSLSTTLNQQPRLRFVHPNGPNPTAVTLLASSRNLQPGQQGLVLAVRGVGNLVGSCRRGHPAVTFRLTTGRLLAGSSPVVTEVRTPLARPIGFLLLTGFLPPAPSPAGGEQRFAFFQVVGGSERADFSLALWATLTPAAGGCAFAANGVLRVRGPDFLQRLG